MQTSDICVPFKSLDRKLSEPLGEDQAEKLETQRVAHHEARFGPNFNVDKKNEIAGVGFMQLGKHSQPDDHAQGPDAVQFGHFSLQLNGLPGTWLNTNKDSRGIVKVSIIVKGPKLLVRAFGAADPEPSDWGEVEADHIYAGSISARIAAGFTAWYDFEFSQIHLQANWNQGLLVLANFTSFKDGSRRSNYFSREFFHRELPRQEEN